MSDLIRRFFDDFSSNDRALRAMGYSQGSQRLARLMDEANLDANHIWVKAEPIGTAHIDLSKKIGVAVSKYRDGTVNGPTNIRKVGTEFWVCNYYSQISRFDENWSFLGYWGRFGDAINTALYNSVRDIAVDEANDRVFIVMSNNNRVRCFSLSSADHIWSWGDGSKGDYATNQPDFPCSCEVLPNGNLAVAVKNGRGTIGGQEGIYGGYIAELDAETGNPVACRLMKKTDGYPWQDEVSLPTQIRILNGRLYISNNDINLIGVFDPTTWDYIETFARPAGFDVQSVYPNGICLNDAGDQLVVAANSPKLVVALGLTDHDYKWHSGTAGWDDRVSAENKPGEFFSINGILPIGNGFYAVADMGNNRVSIVPEFNYFPVQYQFSVPPGYRLVKEQLPPGFDPSTGILMVHIAELQNVSPIYLACEREAA